MIISSKQKISDYQNFALLPFDQIFDTTIIWADVQWMSYQQIFVPSLIETNINSIHHIRIRFSFKGSNFFRPSRKIICSNSIIKITQTKQRITWINKSYPRFCKFYTKKIALEFYFAICSDPSYSLEFFRSITSCISRQLWNVGFESQN
jgi:hypothetical protein